MNKPPQLSAGDIRAEVGKLYQADRDHHLFAFYGRGSDDVVDVKEAGQVFVRPVRSELDLRAQLAQCDEEARIVFLVPWTEDIPLDLAGRFALQGRVRCIGVESRLKSMFKAPQIDEGVSQSPLAAYLLQHHGDAQLRVSSGRLGEAQLWDSWLSNIWEIPLGAEPAIDSLLGWAAHDARGPEWLGSLKGEDGERVRQALLAYLDQRLGVLGPLVWRSWQRGEAASLLELGLLLDAIARQEGGVFAYWRRIKVKAELGIDDDAEANKVAQELALVAKSAHRSCRSLASSAQARLLLERADERVDDENVRQASAASTLLPSAWRHRLDAIGQALSEGLDKGGERATPAAVSQAKSRVDALTEHLQFHDDETQPTCTRAVMAVRLLAWLAARPDEKMQGPTGSFSEAERLGRWYAEEGGYVDWARSYARGSGVDRFNAGVAAVVEAADRARQKMDRDYAEGLLAWCEAERPIRQLLPIEHAIERVAVPFLDAADDHSVVVLLIDGMAWAQAVEILNSLGQRAVPWGPLCWHQQKAGKLGESALPVMVTTLPSQTDVSRAAFFAGKPIEDGLAEPSRKDVERFKAHQGLAKYFESGAGPKLMLRSEGHTAGGAVSQEALTLVGDTSQRVVGLVINAIDASLKGDPQHQPVWDDASIKSLAPLLDKAREVGRSVLLVSDHGHVPSSRFVASQRDTAGAGRWRHWRDADEALAEGELGFRGAGVFTPRGAHGIVMWTDDAHRYGGTAHAGDHGGATLAETIAPCLLIGPDGEGDAESARGVSRHSVPSWWVFDVREPAEPVVEEPASAPVKKPDGKKPGGKKSKVNPNQLSLLASAGGDASAGEAAPGGEALAARASGAKAAEAASFNAGLATPLIDNELLQAREPDPDKRRLILKAVDYLLASNNVASHEDFGGAMGEVSIRVAGLVSQELQGALNVDGYDVISYDYEGRLVRLNKGQLEALFEVKL